MITVLYIEVEKQAGVPKALRETTPFQVKKDLMIGLMGVFVWALVGCQTPQENCHTKEEQMVITMWSGIGNRTDLRTKCAIKKIVNYFKWGEMDL